MTIMALITFLVWLLVVGILWWGVNQILAILAPYVAEPFFSVIRIVMIIILCLLLISAILQLVGMATPIGIKLPTLK